MRLRFTADEIRKGLGEIPAEAGPAELALGLSRLCLKAGDVADALWHGRNRNRTEEALGTATDRSICGELSGRIAQRVCVLANEKRGRAG